MSKSVTCEGGSTETEYDSVEIEIEQRFYEHSGWETVAAWYGGEKFSDEDDAAEAACKELGFTDYSF